MNRKMIGWIAAAVVAAVGFAVFETIAFETDPPLAGNEPGGIVCVPVGEERTMWVGIGQATNTGEDPVVVSALRGSNIDGLTVTRMFAQTQAEDHLGSSTPMSWQEAAEFGLVDFTGGPYIVAPSETAFLAVEVMLDADVSQGEMEGFRLRWDVDGETGIWAGNGPKVILVEDECPTP